MLWLLFSCTSPTADTSSAPGSDSGVVSGDLEKLFSYALIADPHVTGEGEHDARLRAAVEVVSERASSDGIELVFVLGDIAWGGGYALAHDALSALPVPWIPVFGDNPIQVGEEPSFEETFGAQLDALGEQVAGWSREPVPVENPERGGESWLHNARLTHGGVEFWVVDWNSREVGTLFGETPDLHDFPGGTLPFLSGALDDLGEGPDKRVVLLSHMAPFPGPGGLTVDEQETMRALFEPHTEAVWGNHAGHLHASSAMNWEELDFEIVTTDATWDDLNTIRIVEVWGDGSRFVYEDTLVDVD